MVCWSPNKIEFELELKINSVKENQCGEKSGGISNTKTQYRRIIQFINSSEVNAESG